MRCGLVLVLAIVAGGCATQKESFTPRTGIEQLLISSAIDRSLDQVDLEPLHDRNVFLETKYLECVDKNYVILSLHQRLMRQRVKLVDRPDADVILEVGSGAVGTDNQELFVGIPEIPLPPPSPIAIPRLALLTRSKMNGTAKLLVVAFEARSKRPVLLPGPALARSDQNNWNVLGSGPVQTGSVQQEIAAATGPEFDLSVTSAVQFASRPFLTSPTTPAHPGGVVQAGHSDAPPKQ